MLETYDVYRRGIETPIASFKAQDGDQALGLALESLAISPGDQGEPDIDCVASWCTLLAFEVGGQAVEYQVVERPHNPLPWE